VTQVTPGGRRWWVLAVAVVVAAVLAVGLGLTGSDERAPRATPGPTVTADCPISRILVPSCGAWWGSAAVPGGVPNIEALEQTLGTPLPIAHFYARDGRTIPSEAESALARRSDAPVLLFVNVKPGWIASDTFISWADVAEGGADEYLDRIADSIIALDQPLFLAIHHEPEDEVVETEGSGNTAADYVAMYRHVVDRIETRIAASDGDVVGPTWVWNVTGFPRWEQLWPQLYPGDEYVDWVAYDPYLQEPRDCDFSCVVNRTYVDYPEWTGFYDWATQQYPDKPLMLGEWGVRESRLAGGEDAKADVFASVPDLLETQYPRLGALVYFDDGKELDDPTASRIDTSAAALEAFQQAVGSEYFTKVTPRSLSEMN
jgi:hypothetical protein